MTKQEEHVAVSQTQEDSSTLAVVSMVLGIVSLTGPGLFLGIPAIVTAIIALKKKLAGRGLAITGLVTGIVSTVVSLLFCIFMVFLITWGITHPEEFNDLPHQDAPSIQHDQTPFEPSRT